MGEFVLTGREKLLPDDLKNDLGGWREELDLYYHEMQKFQTMEPDEIFMRLSGYSARASHIRNQIMRMTSVPMTKFRTGEIDPFLAECDRQFRVCSRAFSVRSLDWDITKANDKYGT